MAALRRRRARPAASEAPTAVRRRNARGVPGGSRSRDRLGAGIGDAAVVPRTLVAGGLVGSLQGGTAGRTQHLRAGGRRSNHPRNGMSVREDCNLEMESEDAIAVTARIFTVSVVKVFSLGLQGGKRF